jgi:hypothetical protein
MRHRPPAHLFLFPRTHRWCRLVGEASHFFIVDIGTCALELICGLRPSFYNAGTTFRQSDILIDLPT